MTLDYVITDIGTDVFDYGMTYVSLSRVRTLEGLSLISFDSSKIMANPVVLDYYSKIMTKNSKEEPSKEPSKEEPF